MECLGGGRTTYNTSKYDEMCDSMHRHTHTWIFSHTHQIDSDTANSDHPATTGSGGGVLNVGRWRPNFTITRIC